MKSIWIINHYADPPGPGKYTRHYNFAKKLQERGYKVKIFTASTIHTTDINFITNAEKYKEMTIDGVDFVFVKASNYQGNSIKRVKNMLDYFLRVQMVTKSFEKPDIIYTSAPHSLTWLAAYRIAKRNHAKFVVETRDLWPETFVQMGKMKRNSLVAKILYSIEKFIYKKADNLIFTMPGGKDYVENIGLDSSKVSYINNGIDIEKFNYDKKNYLFHDVDLDNEQSFKVLYTGAMGQANELSYLMKAAKKIQDLGILDIKFILFGDGYQKKELENYAKNNNLKNIVFKGRVDKKYIPNILSKSNLNIFTGKHIELYKYGLSLNKMFEYFGSGKPTLSNIATNYDILEKYGSGITVKGDSVEALTEGILTFYNMDKEDYNKYCENSKKAAKEFDFNKLTDTLIHVFEEGE